MIIEDYFLNTQYNLTLPPTIILNILIANIEFIFNTYRNMGIRVSSFRVIWM